MTTIQPNKSSRGLKNRTATSNAIRTDLYLALKQMSQDTGIPFSRLLDRSIEHYLNKMNDKTLS